MMDVDPSCARTMEEGDTNDQLVVPGQAIMESKGKQKLLDCLI